MSSNLKKIIVEHEIYKDGDNKEYMIKDILLQYNTYDISLVLESTGIKRIYNIFDCVFLNLGKQKLILIDELDVNLHSDLFKMLIEMNMVYGKATLLFTTHDLQIMELLDKDKKAILLMDLDANIVNIPKGGGKTPINNYLNDKYNNPKLITNTGELFRSINVL